MKIALPSALVFAVVVFVGILFSHLPWRHLTPSEFQVEHQKLEEAKEKWYDVHPAEKAENDRLTEKTTQAWKEKREASAESTKATVDLDNDNAKNLAAITANDPALEKQAQLEHDNHYASSHRSEIVAEYNYLGRFSLLELVAPTVRVLPYVLIFTGIILLVRLPSLAAAHLYLSSILLPAACYAPLLIQWIGLNYSERVTQGGIAEFVEPEATFLDLRELLIWDYAWLAPSLVLYLAILIRIYYRDRKIAAPASA